MVPAQPRSPASDTEAPSAPVHAAHAHGEHECMNALELASWLRVDRKTVYEYAARNVIPCRRLGRRLVFHRPAVAAWLARSSTVDTPPAFTSGRHQRPSNP
jgi:excisionase family DNA binding protein